MRVSKRKREQEQEKRRVRIVSRIRGTKRLRSQNMGLCLPSRESRARRVCLTLRACALWEGLRGTFCGDACNGQPFALVLACLTIRRHTCRATHGTISWAKELDAGDYKGVRDQLAESFQRLLQSLSTEARSNVKRCLNNAILDKRSFGLAW